jgi:CubicO group peptidase (beta-lactamase class C family)
MRTKALSIVSVAVVASVLGSWCVAAAAASPQGLVGIWSSERTFGPLIAGGVVILRRHDASWNAHIGYEDAQSSGSPSEANFKFSGGTELRVRLTAGSVLGQWIQPATVTTGSRFASPVEFVAAGDNTWLGHVHPLADVQHLYLFITPAAGGGLNAFIRNPESNVGAHIGTRSVVVNGQGVFLRKAGSRDIIGRSDTHNTTLTFHFEGFPDSFVFTKSQERTSSSQFAYHVPARNSDGWSTGSLREAGLDISKISALMNLVAAQPTSAVSPYIQSVQIARHGKLVLDEYFNDFTIDRPHDVRSAGKSVTTLMLGRAIAGGAALGAQTPVYLLFAQYAPFGNDDLRKQAMTVAHLMTMSSGYACDDNNDTSPGNEDTMESQTAQPDWYKYTLDLPIVAEPGTKAVYCSAGINLLGGIITKATNAWLPDYFYDTFAHPMQFGHYAMWLTPPPLDTAYMAGGDYLLPRDFLKFGQLLLDHGRWHSTTIVDNAWLVESTRPWASLNSPGDYGYGWHLYTFNVDGRKIKAISAGGNGGQLLFVFPQLDMTVMITAANYGQYPVWQKFITDLVPNYIIRAAK